MKRNTSKAEKKLNKPKKLRATRPLLLSYSYGVSQPGSAGHGGTGAGG